PPPNLNPDEAAYISILPISNGQTGTVGETLETPLSVMVLDASSKPVQGASVTFRVISGGGEISDITPTDQFGVATATLTLGQETSVDPVYARQNASDKYITQAGLNVVDAYLSSSFGVVTTAQPFTAIGYPGEAVKLVLSNEDFVLGRVVLPLPYYALFTMVIQARDSFGNSVSNVQINFEPDHWEANELCSDLVEARAEVFGDGVTRVGGAAARLFAGWGYDSYALEASADGIAEKPRAYVSFVPGDSRSWACTVCVTHLYTANESTIDSVGNAIDAVKAGGKLPRYGLTRLMDINGIRETNLIEVDHKAITSGASILNENILNGRSEFDLQTSSSAGYNELEAKLENYYKAERTPPLPQGCPAFDPSSATERGKNEFTKTYGAGGAFGIELEVSQITSLDVPASGNPGFVYLNASNRSIYPTEIQFNVFPSDYATTFRDIDIYQDDVLIIVKPSSTASGPGSVTLPPGITFDPESTYEAELVINRGTEFEIRSERFPIPIRTDLIQ
ncbi:MAG: hypothetical protein GY938_22650, partial [Ketobacter sp.]|nr:hypothetical protein [Ketobacter sp.]